jgi:hypothetical protein
MPLRYIQQVGQGGPPGGGELGAVVPYDERRDVE